MWREATTAKGGRKQAQRLFAALCCEGCGSTGRLHRHHLDEDPTNNISDNIQVLCPTCHAQEHKRVPVKLVCVDCKKASPVRGAKRCSSCLWKRAHIRPMRRV